MVKKILEELDKMQEDAKLWSDSQIVIYLVNNSSFHLRTKHIKLRYHFIKAALEDGSVRLRKIHTSQNPTDMFTKVVTKEKLGFSSISIGLKE